MMSPPCMLAIYNLDLQKYKDAADAFVEALKLDPGNDEVENALRY